MLHEAAPCTCGLLYGSCGGGCSLLFASAAGDHHHHYYRHCGGGDGEASFGSGPYGGSVDCTLSLGTPSTRRAEAGVRAPAPSGGMHWEAPVPSCNGNSRQQDSGAARGVSAAEASNAAGARRCANCDTTSTPLWRNGPRGPKSLCNACGIRYKKEERRAAAAAAAPASDGGVEYASSYGYARQPQQWGCYGPAAVAKAASFGMFGDAGGEVDGPCLPWGLGVMPSSSPAFGAVREMPSLFQYY